MTNVIIFPERVKQNQNRPDNLLGLKSCKPNKTRAFFKGIFIFFKLCWFYYGRLLGGLCIWI
ncbi:MAG: hypothetical protein QM652_06925 [Legionella sp.]|uniref:hypothetical protein n=1 Tax=Legionella sp. TaxID=459 RepID=UPI0039E6F287